MHPWVRPALVASTAAGITPPARLTSCPGPVTYDLACKSPLAEEVSPGGPG